jgi:general secretion pathway protein A
MYLDFYGFSETPFSLSPNPRFIFFSKTHKEAFALLLYGINKRFGFIELTGEVGTGKTTILRTLLSQLEEEKYRTALIFNPSSTTIDLMRAINQEFGIPAQWENATELLDELNRFLLDENSAGRTVVLIIDEAQNLSAQLLEQVRLISNLETETSKLIQIVLAGQPELGRILEKPELRQINQRIALRYNLHTLDREDSRAYIAHRLAMAGGDDKVSFSQRAFGWLYRYSRGTPRLINILCDRALLIAYTGDRRKITARTVALAFRDVMLKPAFHVFPAPRKMAAFAVATVLLAISVFIYLALGKTHLSTRPAVAPTDKTVLITPHKTVTPSAPKPAVNQNVKPVMPTVVKPPPDQGIHRIVQEMPVADLPPVAGEQSALPGLTQALRNEISLRSESKNAFQAFNALASFWQVPKIGHLHERLPIMDQIKGQAGIRHLEIARFNGKMDELIRLNLPALLNLSPKGSKGSLLVAVTGLRDGNLIINPPLLGRYTFKKAELSPLYSGQAYILWRNGENIHCPMALGAEGNDVIRVQILLQAAGFRSMEVSGLYDEATVKNVKDFQASRKISVTGKVGPITLIQLYRAVNGASFPSLAKHGKGDGV